jgi:hypothetical protein
VAQRVEHLPSKPEALIKKKERKKGVEQPFGKNSGFLYKF